MVLGGMGGLIGLVGMGELIGLGGMGGLDKRIWKTVKKFILTSEAS